MARPVQGDVALDGKEPRHRHTVRRLVVAGFAAAVVGGGLALAVPALSGHAQAADCLAESRDEYSALLDTFPADLPELREDFERRWNTLAVSSHEGDTLFGAAQHAGHSFCVAVSDLVGAAKTVSDTYG